MVAPSHTELLVEYFDAKVSCYADKYCGQIKKFFVRFMAPPGLSPDLIQ